MSQQRFENLSNEKQDLKEKTMVLGVRMNDGFLAWEGYLPETRRNYWKNFKLNKGEGDNCLDKPMKVVPVEDNKMRK